MGLTSRNQLATLDVSVVDGLLLARFGDEPLALVYDGKHCTLALIELDGVGDVAATTD